MPEESTWETDLQGFLTVISPSATDVEPPEELLAVLRTHTLDRNGRNDECTRLLALLTGHALGMTLDILPQLGKNFTEHMHKEPSDYSAAMGVLCSLSPHPDRATENLLELARGMFVATHPIVHSSSSGRRKTGPNPPGLAVARWSFIYHAHRFSMGEERSEELLSQVLSYMRMM